MESLLKFNSYEFFLVGVPFFGLHKQVGSEEQFIYVHKRRLKISLFVGLGFLVMNKCIQN